MQFVPFPKIARLNRDIVVTEKLDGTNASITIVREDTLDAAQYENLRSQPELIIAQRQLHGDDGPTTFMLAGSRTRFLEVGKDNFGFAGWVSRNAEALFALGDGTHFGEWWGNGIQRGYGLQEKRFSLFNTGRWNAENVPSVVGVVPVLYTGPFSQPAVNLAIFQLRNEGSVAAPGYMDPEGVVVFHTASSTLYKVTVKGDEKPKGQN